MAACDEAVANVPVDDKVERLAEAIFARTYSLGSSRTNKHTATLAIEAAQVFFETCDGVD